jgi:single-stranded-DNA-specific exonuclease
MKHAVERIERGLSREEKIVIYGDYDVDGVTSAALLLGVIKRFGGKISYYIPDRFDEGYGLNADAIQTIAEQGATLLITVDCGMRAANEIELAGRLGMDVIVTDHHLPGEKPPGGLAVINPKQDGDDYPFQELAGVGLAYKLAQALHRKRGLKDPEETLDLVALGTVADMAILQGENRTLVARGIESLRRTERVGLMELARVGRINLGKVNTGTIGFVLGPRLNAAGRLGSAEDALHLLATKNKQEAEDIAEQLDITNRRRQELTAATVEKAIQKAIGEGEVPVLLFAADEAFNEGVVGLGASRLVDKFHRPALVCNRSGEMTRGSARSIPGFHISNAIDRCSDLLVKHGGHARAAGFTLETVKEKEFAERMKKIAEEELVESDLVPKLHIDAEVDMDQLSNEILEFFERLEPCGEGNRTPVLMTRNAKVLARRAVGLDGKHLKLTLGQKKRSMDAIAFRMGELENGIPSRIDVAYNFERNEYLGVESMQMNILDIHW